jgi:hypothetical protein
MQEKPQRWSLLKLASLAGVAHKVAYEARDRSVLVPQVLSASDVLPLRTFDALRRVTWPRQSYARNTASRLRLWEVLAIERSRMDVWSVPEAAGLYVHPAGCRFAESASQHAMTTLELAESGSPYLYLPTGVWAQQTREALVPQCRGASRTGDDAA